MFLKAIPEALESSPRSMKISVARLDLPVAGIHSIDAAATDRGVCRISLNRQPVAPSNWAAAFGPGRAVQFVRGGALLDKLFADIVRDRHRDIQSAGPPLEKSFLIFLEGNTS